MTHKHTGRWRCLTVGCNPRLNAASAATHKADTGHRVARWPVRSEAGKRKQRERNREQWEATRVRMGWQDDDGSFLRDPEAEAEYFGS